MRVWMPWAVGLVLAGSALAQPSGPPAPASSPALAASYESPVALAVDAGYLHTCAIRMDRTLVCWGEHDVGQATPPAGTYVAVSAGAALSCAIRSNGTLACWGYNEQGEATPPPGTFTAVSTSGGHSCAIRSDGTLACWGENYAGQASPPAGMFTAVSARSDHTCAIRVDGTVACWGYNEFGQANPPAGTFIAVSASGDHTCAIETDGTLACWGDDEYGQATPPAGTFTSVSAGFAHTCAVRTDGTLACWGNDFGGQSTAPAGTFAEVSAGGNHTCAIRTDNALLCWGDNEFGQLTPRPTAVLKTLPTFLATSAVPLSWSAEPAFDPVASYEVRYRRAAWNGGFGPFVTWKADTTATSGTLTAWAGYTYCVSVHARDTAGVRSFSTPETCTAVPLDDRSLSRSSGWSAGTGDAYYRSTYVRSSTYGAKLTRTGVVAKRIALLATTCPTCGTVKVYWGSTLLKTISLHSDATVTGKLISVASFSGARTGTLAIKVSSSGKKVIIDGVAIRRN